MMVASNMSRETRCRSSTHCKARWKWWTPMKFDITLYAELLIYTGYAWRNMTEAEKEILEPGRVLAEYPENPGSRRCGCGGRNEMKNVLLVLSAGQAIVLAGENAILKSEMETQAQQYETRLEVQGMEYRDELIEVQEEHQRDKDELAKVREELRGKQFEFDMATNRVEQLNKEIGEGGQHD